MHLGWKFVFVTAIQLGRVTIILYTILSLQAQATHYSCIVKIDDKLQQLFSRATCHEFNFKHLICLVFTKRVPDTRFLHDTNQTWAYIAHYF